MKRFKYNFRAFFTLLLIILTTGTKAQDLPTANEAGGNESQQTSIAQELPVWLDSVDISLLTCGPGQEVWSYYGHTALRIEDHAHGKDLAANWGVFSFDQDYFILRFVFGITDYQIGVFPMQYFIAEYTAEGRWVKQQRLALTRAEKLQILKAIDENNKPENRTYRYNFFFDNCTTRARDMIINHLGAQNTDFKNVDAQSTYRKEIHRWNENHRWARFGNDLLLGCMADRPINKDKWEFLPVNLCDQFDIEARKDTAASNAPRVDIYPEKARYIKLVDSTFYVVQPQAEVAESEPITPYRVFAILGIIVILLSVYEIRTRKNFWWIDTILLTITGLPGLILLAMIFSEHPTVQINFQILLLNPLNLIFVYKVSKQMRKGYLPLYYEVWGLMLLAGLFLQIWQSYAEGMGLLALTLLIRYAVKSTLLDLGNNKFGLQAFVIKKIYRANKKNLNK